MRNPKTNLDGEERTINADQIGPESNSASPEPTTELDTRLENLSRSLEKESRERAEKQRPKKSDTAGFGLALRLASEFVAGIIVGAALGWGLDKVAGTSPWGLIVFLMLGFVAGVFNVLRASGEMSKSGVQLEKKNGDPEGSG